MDIFKKIYVLFFLVGVAVSPSACQKLDDDKLNKDQKEILKVYVSEYLHDKHQYLYYKSEESLSPLNPPLTPDDFKLPEVALWPDAKAQKTDTLFSEEELSDWSKKVSKYEQLKWDQNNFSDSVDFIKKEEIPDYLNKTDIPPPGQDPVFIHYLSIPFVYQGKSALMYSRRWSSGANVKVRYHYFKKREKKWKIIQEGPLNTGY